MTMTKLEKFEQYKEDLKEETFEVGDVAYFDSIGADVNITARVEITDVDELLDYLGIDEDNFEDCPNIDEIEDLFMDTYDYVESVQNYGLTVVSVDVA